MSKALPYFRWFPADAETDELYASLSDAELGFFHRLLNRSWRNNGLPADLDELALTMRVRRSYLNKLWANVSKCFVLTDSDSPRFVNPRQEKERAHAISKSTKATSAIRTRYGRSTNVLPRAYESDSYSSIEEKTTSETVKSLRPSWEEINAAWKWYVGEYPSEVNPLTDMQLFISVMETAQDIADIRSNLPLWKSKRKWREGYCDKSENFLSKRVFKIVPKDDVIPNGNHPSRKPPGIPAERKIFDPRTITGNQ